MIAFLQNIGRTSLAFLAAIGRITLFTAAAIRWTFMPPFSLEASVASLETGEVVTVAALVVAAARGGARGEKQILC